jgi:hypothetical protein
MFQDVTAAARPNLSDAEPRELEEPLTEYSTVLCTVKTTDGPTECNTVYYTVYRYWRGPTKLPTTEETPLAKLLEVGVMFDRCNNMRLSKSQTAYGHPPRFSSGRTGTYAFAWTTGN